MQMHSVKAWDTTSYQLGLGLFEVTGLCQFQLTWVFCLDISYLFAWKLQFLFVKTLAQRQENPFWENIFPRAQWIQKLTEGKPESDISGIIMDRHCPWGLLVEDILPQSALAIGGLELGLLFVVSVSRGCFEASSKAGM